MAEVNVTLLIDKKEFKVNKDLLCEHSGYFRAMFSGNYAENDKKVIPIQDLDALSTEIIIEYMKTGSTDLTEYSYFTLFDLVTAAHYLQITELMKLLEDALLAQEILSTNCMDLMTVARDCQFKKLEEKSAKEALCLFRSMKPEDVPDISRLCWYLSHPHLDASSELEVFNFGHKWVTENGRNDDALLIILGCLDLKELTPSMLLQMKRRVSHEPNNMATKVIDCLNQAIVLNLNLFNLKHSDSTKLLDVCPKPVCDETLKLVKNSLTRKSLTYAPMLLVWTSGEIQVYRSLSNAIHWTKLPLMYERNLKIAAWGMRKMVIIGMTVDLDRRTKTQKAKPSLSIYNVLKKTYFSLPWESCIGQPVVVGDHLYIITGRIHFFVTTIYNLEKRTTIGCYRSRIGGTEIQDECPAVCVHDGVVYAAGSTHIYEFIDMEPKGLEWRPVVPVESKVTHLVSFKGYIYCTQDTSLRRFRPGVDNTLETIAHFEGLPLHVCNLGFYLQFIVKHDTGGVHEETYYGLNVEEQLIVENRMFCEGINIKNIISYVPQVLEMKQPLQSYISDYAKEYLDRYRSV